MIKKLEVTFYPGQEGATTYNVPDFISGLMFRRAAEMEDKLKNAASMADADTLVDYVVQLFGDQFTAEEYWAGIPVEKVLTFPVECIRYVTSKVGGAVPGAKDPNEAARKA